VGEGEREEVEETTVHRAGIGDASEMMTEIRDVAGSGTRLTSGDRGRGRNRSLGKGEVARWCGSDAGCR
jgi:hypothetical protein